MDVFHCCSQHVAIVVTKSNGLTWLLSGIYASTDYREWKVLWHEMRALVDQGIPTIMVGDFNCVLRPKDKRRGQLFVKDTGFKEFR